MCVSVCVCFFIAYAWLHFQKILTKFVLWHTYTLRMVMGPYGAGFLISLTNQFSLDLVSASANTGFSNNQYLVVLLSVFPNASCCSGNLRFSSSQYFHSLTGSK